jgi:predicted dithiol-disulfide oxidoreductase (DUF899 family)
MSISFPGESAEYRAARDRLLEREIELRRVMEAVAAERRALPPGGVVPEDYVFQGAGPDGSPTNVRLSELFAPGKDSLVIYSMMFPRYLGDTRPGPAAGETARLPLGEGPCPSCTSLLDQLEGAAEHVTQRVNLVAVGKAPAQRILTFAKERGWRRLRLLSSAGNTYQPGLPRRDAGGVADAHAERVPPRRRDDSAFLGLGAPLRAHRTRPGLPPRRHYRAALESARPRPRRTRNRLGGAAAVLVTDGAAARATFWRGPGAGGPRLGAREWSGDGRFPHRWHVFGGGDPVPAAWADTRAGRTQRRNARRSRRRHQVRIGRGSEGAVGAG